jgi:hypothetical protein
MMTLFLAAFAAAPKLTAPPVVPVTAETHPDLFRDACEPQVFSYQTPPELAHCIGMVVPRDFVVTYELTVISRDHWQVSAEQQHKYAVQADTYISDLKRRNRGTTVKAGVTVAAVAVACLAAGFIGGKLD